MDVKLGKPLVSMKGMAAAQLRDAVKVAKTVNSELERADNVSLANREPGETYQPTQSHLVDRDGRPGMVQVDTADPLNRPSPEFDKAVGNRRVRAEGRYFEDQNAGYNLIHVGDDGEPGISISTKPSFDGKGTDYWVSGTSMGPMVATERNGVMYAQYVEGKAHGDL